MTIFYFCPPLSRYENKFCICTLCKLCGTATRNAFLPGVPTSIPPKTHCSRTRRPTLYLWRQNRLSSISTVMPGPPATTGFTRKCSPQMSRQKLFQSTIVCLLMTLSLTFTLPLRFASRLRLCVLLCQLVRQPSEVVAPRCLEAAMPLLILMFLSRILIFLSCGELFLGRFRPGRNFSNPPVCDCSSRARGAAYRRTRCRAPTDTPARLRWRATGGLPKTKCRA